MSNSQIKEIVEKIIRQIANEQSIPIQTIVGTDAIVDDLGFASLDIATLVALLEAELKVDPFASSSNSIAEMRTVNDICEIYSRCLANTNIIA